GRLEWLGRREAPMSAASPEPMKGSEALARFFHPAAIMRAPQGRRNRTFVQFGSSRPGRFRCAGSALIAGLFPGIWRFTGTSDGPPSSFRPQGRHPSSGRSVTVQTILRERAGQDKAGQLAAPTATPATSDTRLARATSHRYWRVMVTIILQRLT